MDFKFINAQAIARERTFDKETSASTLSEVIRKGELKKESSPKNPLYERLN